MLLLCISDLYIGIHFQQVFDATWSRRAFSASCAIDDCIFFHRETVMLATLICSVGPRLVILLSAGAAMFWFGNSSYLSVLILVVYVQR